MHTGWAALCVQWEAGRDTHSRRGAGCLGRTPWCGEGSGALAPAHPDLLGGGCSSFRIRLFWALSLVLRGTEGIKSRTVSAGGMGSGGVALRGCAPWSQLCRERPGGTLPASRGLGGGLCCLGGGPSELIKGSVAPQHCLFLVLSQGLVTSSGQRAGAEISYLWTMR